MGMVSCFLSVAVQADFYCRDSASEAFLLIYNHQFSSNIRTIFSSAVSDSETDRKQCSGWTLGWAAWGNDVTMTINRMDVG